LTLGRLEKTFPDEEEQIAFYKRLLRKKPSRVVLLDFLAEAYYRLAEYDEAIHCWKKLLSKHVVKEEHRLNSKIAQAYELQGEAEQAYYHYYLATQDNPDNLELLGKYGELAYLIENYQEALEVYHKITEMEPENDIAWHNLGLANYNVGNHKQALEDLKIALELNPQSAETLYTIASIYSENYLMDDALDYLDRALTLEPEMRERAIRDQAFYALKDLSVFELLMKI
jgi:tetratricopeptide (TPR) repeat protein